MRHFERELSDLKARAKALQVSVGNKEEMVSLRQQTQEAENFVEEAKKSTSVSTGMH